MIVDATEGDLDARQNSPNTADGKARSSRNGAGRGCRQRLGRELDEIAALMGEIASSDCA